MINKAITYYLINDRLLGKKEGLTYYLFRNAGWVLDEKNVIADHLAGFDPGEPEDSPYRFGNGTMSDIEVITYERAIQLISERS